MKKQKRKKVRRTVAAGVLIILTFFTGTVFLTACGSGGQQEAHQEETISPMEEGQIKTLDTAEEERQTADKEAAVDIDSLNEGEAADTAGANGSTDDTVETDGALSAAEALVQEEDLEPEILNLPVWVTTGEVNLRSEPSTDSQVIQKLGRNIQLTLLYEENGWGAVEGENLSGYVSMDYLTKEEPAANDFVVVIDPGHQKKGDSTQEPNGPSSSTMKARVTGGTSGRTTGVMEYELNLDISLQLRDELEARGYTVYMTRETHDINISNMERAQYATSVGADIAVRIHANGSEDSSVSGALALTPSSSNPYVSNLASDSRILSQCILDAYCEATGMNNQGVITSDTMTGINWSTVPVTILEMGYMTNSSDDVNMEDAAYQTRMVQGIADGVDDYFGL